VVFYYRLNVYQVVCKKVMKMKKLSLRDVMFHQRLVILGDGFCIANSAGSANYDKFGQRTTVSGIPEYFPLSLIIDNKTSGTLVSVGEAYLSSPCRCSSYCCAVSDS
jgi:hypothetical protein